MDKRKIEKTVEVPEQYLELIADENNHQTEALDKMLNMSMKIIRLEEGLEKGKEILKKEKEIQKLVNVEILKTTQTIKKILSKAHKKLGLGKDRKYTWEFNGKAFLGILNPNFKEQKKEETK